MILVTALILLCSAAVADEPRKDTDPLTLWLNTIAQKQLSERDAAIAKIKTVPEAEERKEQVRARILELLGGLPDYDGPLNPRSMGRIDAGAYVIEKVTFESLPRYVITANLYLPKGYGPFPGVLMPMGHWEEGKPAGQRISANLAMKGFAVLAFDPMGQGERLQSYDIRIGKSLAGGSVDQHFMAGTQSLMIGQSFARYRIWDAKRALDYLLSRPEVDKEKIGCTGCSGGGTLTTYISALDSRIKVAAPACYMNSFKILFTGDIGDSEQSLPDFLSSGLDQTDYVELFAPKPWLIASTEKDFFTPAGAKLVYEEARRWYRIYDAESKVKWVIGPGGHGTPAEVREAIYDWMIRWLKDGKGDARDMPVTMYPNHLLTVTKSGQVSLEGSRDLYEIIREDLRAHQSQGSREALMTELRRITAPAVQGVPTVRVLSEKSQDGVMRRSISIETEPGMEIHGVLLMSAESGRRPGVLMVGDGTAMPQAVLMAKAGNVVLSLAPRGIPAKTDPRRMLGDWLPNTRAWLAGRNLPGMRAHDILNGIEVLASQPGVDAAKMKAAASDTAGVWLLMAAALDPRIGKVWLDRTPHSLRSAFDGPLHTNMHDVVMPGFSLHWDLQDMIRAMDARLVYWTDPSDWLRQVVPLEGPYRYRYFEEPDADLIEEFLR